VHYRTVIYPENDLAFVAFVQAHATPDLDQPKQLEARLREAYPKARVSNGVTEPDGRKRWYVYRDGKWVAP
jgi:hypothetical protein